MGSNVHLSPSSFASLNQLLFAVPKGMGLAQLAALTVVATEPGLSVNELAERIGAPQQNASRYVSQLLGRYQEDEGLAPPTPLIEQRVNHADPRKRALFPAAAGLELLESLIRAGRIHHATKDET